MALFDKQRDPFKLMLREVMKEILKQEMMDSLGTARNKRATSRSPASPDITFAACGSASVDSQV